MSSHRDTVEIQGVRIAGDPTPPPPSADASDRGGMKFLSIWFRCCHTYGRIYRNQARTAYEGRCPKCGATVKAGIGPGGTSQRVFEAG